MTVHEAIRNAEAVLPGAPAPDGVPDERWQAIIAVGEFVEREPDAVWQFVERWGAHEDADLRAAVATCVLEHLLEHHADTIVPLARATADRDARFADTLRRCWTFGGVTPVPCTIVDAAPDDAEAILALQKARLRIVKRGATTTGRSRRSSRRSSRCASRSRSTSC